MTRITDVVLYARVSTKDQDCSRQLADLDAWATAQGWNVVARHVETASGAKNDRIERAKVLAKANKRTFQAILVTEPSRWSRSLVDLVTTLEALAGRGVSLLTQQGVSMDITTSTGRLMVGILGSLAEFERDLIGERVASGLANAVRRGVKLGRKPGFRPSAHHDAQILAYRAQGVDIRGIAASLKISTTTVQKVLKSQAATVHTA